MPSSTNGPRNGDVEELITALLLVAGSWFVLSKALDAVKRANGEKKVPGDEWARKVVGEISKAREVDLSAHEHAK